MLAQTMNKQPPVQFGRTPGLVGLSGARPTMGGANLGVFFPFEALEPNRPATERTMAQLVELLDRDDALLMCGFLNCTVSGSGLADEQERQVEAYRALYDPQDWKQIQDWIGDHGKTSPIVLFFRGQLLELMRWVARFARRGPGNGASFSSRDTRRTFVRAALLASELWSRRTYANKLNGDETPELALERALGAFRKGVEEAGAALHMGVALARGKILFEEHLPARLPSFRTDFQAATGLTIEDYICCAVMLMVKVVDKPTDGRFFHPTYASLTSFDAEFACFLREARQSAGQLAYGLWSEFDAVGFKCLRERPVFVSASGQCVVLDPTYFIDYFTVSPMFKVLSGSRPAKEVFAAFGGAFEDYAVATLRRIYPDHPILTKRLYTEVPHRRQDPTFVVDALVNDGVEVVVMELKTAFIREDTVLSPDPAAFLKELRKRYAVTGNPGDREVGVAQLAKCIRAIVLDRWQGGDIAPDQVERIFPVLLVHDERMGSPGIGSHLNRLFAEQLGGIAQHKAVAPLAVMTIHDLECLESSKEFTLRDLLSAYAARSNGGVMSVHDFLATDPAFRGKIRPNEALMARSFELVDQLKGRLFPPRLHK